MSCEEKSCYRERMRSICTDTHVPTPTLDTVGCTIAVGTLLFIFSGLLIPFRLPPAAANVGGRTLTIS